MYIHILTPKGNRTLQNQCQTLLIFNVLEKVLEKLNFERKNKDLNNSKSLNYQGFTIGAPEGIRTPDLLVRSKFDSGKLL